MPPGFLLLLIVLLLFHVGLCGPNADKIPKVIGINSSYSNEHLNPDLKIQHLHVVFSHGDRSPIVDQIVDEEKSKKLWPQGFGQLTDRGILQEFELGRWIRKRYGQFIPMKYNASDYHMRSTDLDRTLMSAQAVSAGVFLNSSSPLVPYQLHWRPIPVHTVPQKEDILLSTVDCPCLSVLQKVQMDSEKSLQFEKQHTKLFSLLRNQTGMHVDRKNLWEFYDVLTCMRAHNYTLPPWYTEELYQEIKEIEQFYWTLLRTSSPDILRLEIGVFLNSFVEHIKAIVNASLTSAPKLSAHHLSTWHTMAYSAHDTDIAFLLGGLQIYDDQLIDYSATVALELLSPDKPSSVADFSIRVLYKRSWNDSNGVYLQFPYCKSRSPSSGCPLNVVLEEIQPMLVTPEQLVELCAVASSNSTHVILGQRYNPVRTFVLIAFTLGTVLLLISLTVFLLRRIKRRKHLLQDDEQVVFVRFDHHT